MKKKLISMLCLVLCAMTATAQTQATPDMKGQNGPFKKGTDFYYITAVDGKEGVSLFAGDLAKFKEKVTINLTLDISKCETSKQGWFFWEEAEDNDIPEQKMQKIVKRLLNEFQSEFNMKTKKGLQLAEPKAPVTDAPYELVIRIRKMNTGNDSGAWIDDSSMKQGGAVVDGTVELIDTKTGDILCVFAFNRVKSLYGASQRSRVGDAMGTVGRKVGKIIKDYIAK